MSDDFNPVGKDIPGWSLELEVPSPVSHTAAEIKLLALLGTSSVVRVDMTLLRFLADLDSRLEVLSA